MTKSARCTTWCCVGRWSLDLGHSLVIGIWALGILSFTVTASAAGPGDSVLHLTNGGFVPGEIRSSDSANILRWQSPLFVQPFDFTLDGVNAVHYSVPSTLPKPNGEFCFELAAGDVLFGSLLSLTDEHAVIDADRLGKLNVRRDRIQRIYRWRGGADLIYLGPSGLIGWQESSTEKTTEKKWREEGGQLLTDRPGAAIFADLGLPERAVVEFDLSWKTQPDFVLSVGTDNNVKTLARAFRFEIWNSELVVQREVEREADVASLQQIGSTGGRAHLIAYLDQTAGRILVVTPNGQQLADLSVPAKKPVALGGVRLENHKGDVRLERLRISRWNGVPPREVQVNKSRLHRADGSILYGKVSAFDPKTKSFTIKDDQEEATITADQLASIVLSPPDDLAPRKLRIAYQDGLQISGEPVRIEGGRLTLASPNIQEQVTLPLTDLRSLVVLDRAADAVLGMPDARHGRFESEGVLMKGVLVGATADSESSCLSWHPELSTSGSAMRLGISGRVVYRDPPPPPKPQPKQPQVQQRPAGFGQAFLNVLSGNQPVAATSVGRRSLHLRSGDTIPCDVLKIDEKGITFKTTISDATFVEHSQIKAVELIATGSTPKLNKAKRERLLTLPRMQRDSPPTQLICSPTGDFLRGRIVDLDDKMLHIEVRLEIKEVPRDRIAQIIWLHADELGDATKGDSAEGNAANIGEPKAEPTAGIRVQSVRGDGNRLTFVAEQLAEKTLSGKSDVLGNCRADLAQTDILLLGSAIEKAAADLAYHRWRLHHATDPKYVIAGDSDSTERSPGIDSPLVGKPAPDFQLDLLDGKKFQLANGKGRIIVLDFWATWCGPCLQAMPQVEQVIHEFKPEDVQLVAVNLEEAPKQITSTLERHKLNVTVALDRDGVVAGKYAATAIPQTVIIDRAGNVARVFVGGGPKLGGQIREVIQQLLDGPAADSPKEDTKPQ